MAHKEQAVRRARRYAVERTNGRGPLQPAAHLRRSSPRVILQAERDRAGYERSGPRGRAGELAGIDSARRGTYRVLYRINEERREVIVLRAWPAVGPRRTKAPRGSTDRSSTPRTHH